MRKEQVSVKGAQALFAAAFTYAFSGVLVREMESMWGDKAQTAIRYLLVFIVLMIYSFFSKNKVKIPRNKLATAVSLGIAFAMVVLFFTFAIQKTTISNALFTFYATNVAASFLAGTFILKEKISRAKIAAIVFALAGLSFYSGALAAGNRGLMFGVLAGIAAGFTNLFSNLLKGVDRNAILRMEYGVGTIFVWLVTLLSGDQIIRTISIHGIIVTLIFTAILIAAGNLVLYGYQHFDVNIGTVIMSSELIFGTLLAFIFYNEVPKPHELAGGVLILVGSILSSLDLEKLLNKKAAQP